MEISWFKSRRESGMSNSTVDSGYAGSVGSTNGFAYHEGSNGIVQMCGIMQKKPFGHQSTKWSRRFFVLKEGFLLYYAEGEKKTFETKRVFNIHPKGVIPLGNCTIEDLTLPGMPFCINIRHPELKTQVCVATDDEESRKIWIRGMDKATKVTMENTGLSDTMIKSLQEQSLRLARERQEYVDKFISEAEELGAERELREALEEFNQELEDENARIEGLVEDLHAAYEEAKMELTNAVESSKRLEKEREEMRIRTDELQKNLSELSDERSAIIDKLQDHEAREKMPGEENAELARQLAVIEQRAKLLEKDKDEIRLKLEENQMMSKDLLLEREAIAHEAEELKTEMQNLSQEKKLAEEELKEEIVARMRLQKELEECKAALQRLEAMALGNVSVSTQENNRTVENPTKSPERDEVSDNNEQIIRDVKSLREFFENCARDNTLDDKPPPSLRIMLQGGMESSGSVPGSSEGDQNASSSRAFGRRASIIRRRRQAARCKSMVFEDFSLSPMVRDPNHRRSILLSRDQRSMSLSGKNKSSFSKNNDS